MHGTVENVPRVACVRESRSSALLSSVAQHRARLSMIPETILALVAILAGGIAKLLAANGDATKEENALFEVEEALKAERDRRKFGN
jgi:hypothetical protein